MWSRCQAAAHVGAEVPAAPGGAFCHVAPPDQDRPGAAAVANGATLSSDGSHNPPALAMPGGNPIRVLKPRGY